MSLLHVLGFYGWYLGIKYSNWQSFLWAYFVGFFAGFGVLCGAHRLWTHRSYQAHWSLRVLLMILQTLSLQNDIYEWCRDHRVHHKWSETDADPHNSRRGFFFAHMGWLLCRKHPEVIAKGQTIDMSDVWADPIVILIWGVIPITVPMYFWNEPFLRAFFGNMFRYIMSLHQAWLVNSAAHIYGNRPYDKRIEPRENIMVQYLSGGEGYHNYHHTYPWDYSASEYGWKDNFNIATAFIDLFAVLGLAYDRKSVPKPVIKRRITGTGDGSEYRSIQSKTLDRMIAIVVMTWPLWLSYTVSTFIR
ncbi:unnamed protein product [Medioppia subpectinata]|uniref:Fatty acid desaturase domain-containing protein n=1 Tax=Medioppia subpectinata TaxID=1979941 RepID=A0A7R9KCI0_9ACAR|nr:unnamed protein product [Medioppia subpectinata]CAG2100580.1 unnamed protein product [Medioppia subpectinata]